MKGFFAYFGFSRMEQRGFTVLLVIIFMVFSSSFVYDFFKADTKIDHHMTYLSVSEGSKKSSDRSDGNEDRRSDLFIFDPNNLSEDNWRKLGFTDKQIRVIKNYEAKGGRFYKKADVAKIYSITSVDFKRIAPYIVFKDIENDREEVPFGQQAVSRNGYAVKNGLKHGTLDVNQADTSGFKMLNGIGSVLSRRIVKFRDALGGFHDVNQLSEVYGISPDLFRQIEPYFTRNALTVIKLKINEVSTEDLANHPYVTSKQAQLIINFRTQHGNYAQLEDLRKIPTLDDAFFRKIEPYLAF